MNDQTDDNVVFDDVIKTIDESFASVSGTYADNVGVPVPETGLTTEKYIEILDKNIEFYGKLKIQCTEYFSVIAEKIMGYNAQINTAKTQEKKRYFTKKRTKVQENLVELLTRMDALDSATQRAQDKKTELLEA